VLDDVLPPLAMFTPLGVARTQFIHVSGNPGGGGELPVTLKVLKKFAKIFYLTGFLIT
jgi:hypothetical protein